MSRSFAVLTGDLIASTKLTPKQLDLAMSALRGAGEQIADWGCIRYKTYFTPTRGDGWQIVVLPDKFALRAALFARACLRKNGKEYETRISIATGQAEIPADGDLNRASGPAFIASGRGLESLPRFATMGHDAGGAIAAATRLADHISRGWTPTQARVMTQMLLPFDLTQEKVARQFGKTQQAIQQTLSGAGYHALIDALKLIETAPEKKC